MDTSFRVLIKNGFKNDMREGKKRKRERVRKGIKRIREKKSEAEGEIVWRRKNQEDKKEIATLLRETEGVKK